MPRPPLPPVPPLPPGSPGSRLIGAGWRCNRTRSLWNHPTITGDDTQRANWVTIEEATALQKEVDNEG